MAIDPSDAPDQSGKGASGSAPPEPGTATPITPNFRCVLGLMHGYSQSNNKPTAKNIAAMYRDLASHIDYVHAGPNPSWDEVLETIERFPHSFVMNYGNGVWPRC